MYGRLRFFALSLFLSKKCAETAYFSLNAGQTLFEGGGAGHSSGGERMCVLTVHPQSGSCPEASFFNGKRDQEPGSLY